tara:strand:+ start:30483 stop:30710 length:228 start_codon:yes stop_codon:yes gene_type:complete
MQSDVWTKFKRTSGSECFPSNNPGDSPFDTFECIDCSHTFSLRMYGINIYTKSLEEQALDTLRDHLLVKHIMEEK